MICPQCQNELPEGVAVCFRCGQPVTSPPVQSAPPPPPTYAAPPYTAPATMPSYVPQSVYSPDREKPAGLKPFVPKPLNTYPLSSSVRGTGIVGVLAFFAWLAALVSPIAALWRLLSGLQVLIPELVSGTVSGIAGSVIQNLDINADTFSGALGLWDLATGLAGTVQGGVLQFVLGFLLLLLVIIPLFCMMVALRTNYRAGRILLIANLCLCTIGDFLCYSVIKRVTDTIGILQPPYDNIPQEALITAVIAAGLWIVSLIAYLILIFRSKTSYSQRSY